MATPLRRVLKPDANRGMRLRRALPALSVASVVIGAVLSAFEAAADSPEHKVEYRYCKEEDGCTYPGTGYTVCEAMLRMLNSYGADSKPVACALPSDAASFGFKRPAWIELDPAKHLRTVYRLDLATSPVNDSGIARRQLDFESWKLKFAEEVEKGQIAPQLRQTHIRLPWAGDLEILGYDRSKCGRACDKSRPRDGTGLYLYATSAAEAETEDHESYVVGLPLTKYDVVEFRGQYYFVSSMYLSYEDVVTLSREVRWAAEEHVRVYKATPAVPGRNAKISGALDQCQFIATWPKVTDAERSK